MLIYRRTKKNATTMHTLLHKPLFCKAKQGTIVLGGREQSRVIDSKRIWRFWHTRFPKSQISHRTTPTPVQVQGTLKHFSRLAHPNLWGQAPPKRFQMISNVCHECLYIAEQRRTLRQCTLCCTSQIEAVGKRTNHSLRATRRDAQSQEEGSNKKKREIV